MSEATVFNDQVDKLLLSKIITFIEFDEFEDDMWAVVAYLMGGKDAGFTADEVRQRFNKTLKQGEIIQDEHGANVFLGGEALVERKYDLGEVEESFKEHLLAWNKVIDSHHILAFGATEEDGEEEDGDQEDGDDDDDE